MKAVRSWNGVGDASDTRPPFPTGDPRDGRVPTSGTAGGRGSYYVLIALGGGVLLLLTGAVLEPIGVDVDVVAEWVLPTGAAGAVIVAAWLVEPKRVVENMAPVQTGYLPVFAVWAATVVAVLPPVFAFR